MNLPYLFSSLPLNTFLHIFCFSPPEILGLTPRVSSYTCSYFIFLPLTPKKWAPPFQGLVSVLVYPSILSRGGSKIANSKSQCHKLVPGYYMLIRNKLIFYILNCSRNLISLQINNKLDKLLFYFKRKTIKNRNQLEFNTI